MCPACLASIGMLVTAAASAGGAALVAAKIRLKSPEATTQSDGESNGDKNAATENRIQG